VCSSDLLGWCIFGAIYNGCALGFDCLCVSLYLYHSELGSTTVLQYSSTVV
jgi:hypothetical protein